jgi:hypothetical protein
MSVANAFALIYYYFIMQLMSATCTQKAVRRKNLNMELWSISSMTGQTPVIQFASNETDKGSR